MFQNRSGKEAVFASTPDYDASALALQQGAVMVRRGSSVRYNDRVRLPWNTLPELLNVLKLANPLWKKDQEVCETKRGRHYLFCTG